MTPEGVARGRPGLGTAARRVLSALYLVAAAAALAAAATTQLVARPTWNLVQTDWTSYFVGSHLSGQPARLYDAAAQLEAQVAVAGRLITTEGTVGGLLPLISPPWVVLLAHPFARFGIDAGGRAWLGFQVAAALAGGLLLARGRLRPALVAMAGMPLGQLMINMQVTGVLILGLGAAWRLWLAGREFTAGLALGLTLVKPHLALPLAAGLLITRRQRALAGWTVAAAFLLAASEVLLPGSPGAWLRYLAGPAGQTGYAVNLPGAVAVTAGTAAGLAVTAVLIGLALAAAGVCRKDEAKLAVLLLAGPLAAPHLSLADFLLVSAAMAVYARLATPLVAIPTWVALFQFNHQAGPVIVITGSALLAALIGSVIWIDRRQLPAEIAATQTSYTDRTDRSIVAGDVQPASAPSSRSYTSTARGRQ